MRWLRSGIPAPALEPCVEDRLPDGVPDLRGSWKAVRSEGVAEFIRLGLGQPRWRASIASAVVRFTQEERIEQRGQRVAITGGSGRGWVVHQFTADGTWEHGVDDLTIAGRPVQATGTYENGRLVLRGRRDEGEFRVVRELQDDELVLTAAPADGATPPMRIFFRRASR